LRGPILDSGNPLPVPAYEAGSDGASVVSPYDFALSPWLNPAPPLQLAYPGDFPGGENPGAPGLQLLNKNNSTNSTGSVPTWVWVVAGVGALLLFIIAAKR